MGVFHQDAVHVDGLVVIGEWALDAAKHDLAGEFGELIALVHQEASGEHGAFLALLLRSSESWNGLRVPF